MSDIPKIKLERPPVDEAARYAIIWNGTADMHDGVARQTLGITRELTEKWLNYGYQKVFLLMTAANMWAGDPRVVMVEPTEENLRMITGALQTVGMDMNDTVDIFVMGHGGGEGKGHFFGSLLATDFISAINTIPAETQRVIRLSECHAGSFEELGLVRDENDLLMAYSGSFESGEGKKMELNWTDGRDLGVIEAKDVDGDGKRSNWEMFWAGMNYSFGLELPFTRGLIFDVGSKYVDYGFGKTPLEKPFKAEVATVSSMAEYIELTGRGYEKGITVIGFQFDNKQVYPEIEDFKRLAVEHNGWVQFILLAPEMAEEVWKKEGQTNGWQRVQIPDSPRFKVRFSGEAYANDKLFDLDLKTAESAISGLLHGKGMK